MAATSTERSRSALRNIICRLRRRLGRRGAVLLTFCFVDCAIAYSLVSQSDDLQLLTSYGAQRALMPIQWWAVPWLVVAAVCGVQAWMRDDRYGFTAAIAIKVVWAGCFASSWLWFSAPRGWVGAATWATIANLVAILSGWPEPPDSP